MGRNYCLPGDRKTRLYSSFQLDFPQRYRCLLYSPFISPCFSLPYEYPGDFHMQPFVILCTTQSRQKLSHAFVGFLTFPFLRSVAVLSDLLVHCYGPLNPNKGHRHPCYFTLLSRSIGCRSLAHSVKMSARPAFPIFCWPRVPSPFL